MEITINKKELASALQSICYVAKSNKALPILEMTKITAKPYSIFLQATDLEVDISVRVPARVASHWENALIPTKEIKNLLPFISSKSIVIVSRKETLDEYHIELQSEKEQVSKFITENPVRFPYMVPKLHATMTIPRKELIALIEGTLFATTEELARYHFNNILLEAQKEEKVTYLKFIATDGRRLAIVKTGVETTASLPSPQLLPAKAVRILLKVLKHLKEKELQLGFAPASFQVFGKDTWIGIKTRGGKFPNYRKIIPTEDVVPNLALINRKKLLSTLSIPTQKKKDNMDTLFFFSQEGLDITPINKETTKVHISMRYTGTCPFLLLVNRQSIIDYLKKSKEEIVEWWLGPHATVFKSKQGQYILSPKIEKREK